MKISLTKQDKILIGITILLYILGFFIGGWGIIINLAFLYFLFIIIRKYRQQGIFPIYHLIFLIVFIGINLLIKIEIYYNLFEYYSLKKNYEEQVQKSSTSTVPESYTLPILNLIFELPSKLSKCGIFTFFVEDNRVIEGDFPALTCPYDIYLNAYSINDRSEMGSLDIFMNIQGYVKKNDNFYYIRNKNGQIKETLIPIKANPTEIQSNYGIKMLRVKGTGSMSETQPQWWIGGLTASDEGVIINTGNDIYPALVIASDLKKTGLTEEEFSKILMSFKKN